MGLCCNGNNVNGNVIFHGFSDTDWSGDIDISHSSSGQMFIANHSAIGWASKQQCMVAFSTIELEYMDFPNFPLMLPANTSYDSAQSFQILDILPTDIGNDNMAAIICRRILNSGLAIVQHVSTNNMVADIFTKALPHDKHWEFDTAVSAPGSVYAQVYRSPKSVPEREGGTDRCPQSPKTRYGCLLRQFQARRSVRNGVRKEWERNWGFHTQV
jgi:hypothetical protein